MQHPIYMAKFSTKHIKGITDLGLAYSWEF